MASVAAETTAVVAPIELIDVALELERVGEKHIVEGINWRIASGDFWVVGGPHGAGKSDLLATAAGLMAPMRGQQLMFGQPMDQLDEDELLSGRLRVGLVFENGGRLFNHLSVAENIALALCYHRDCAPAETDEWVGALLELMELSRLANQPSGRLGRGWRQRAGLARALALGPEVLLLDNPLAGLEQRQVRWWLEFLNRLAAGHEAFGGKPITLAVSADDLRPWVGHGRQFALMSHRQWQPLGGRAELEHCADPLLRELLMGEAGQTEFFPKPD
jgi:ABC-type transporter Mla maintaining outer membrane lipid asymmetry ATPase subunit MlaF